MSLTGPALQASRAALSAALAEQSSQEERNDSDEIQEIDMQGQAETIRTVFSDPTNFNVKVHILPLLSPSPMIPLVSF